MSLAANTDDLARPTPTEPIPRQSTLNFIALPHRNDAPVLTALPAPGELYVWRYRTEWQGILKGDPRSCVSQGEYQRARHYPNSALAKRYLIGCAALRRVLGAMLDCPPLQLQFASSRREGRLELLLPVIDVPIEAHLAFVGVWLIIAVSRTAMGIGSIIPGPMPALAQESGQRRVHMRRDAAPDAAAKMRHAARCGSISALTGRPIDELEIHFSAHPGMVSTAEFDGGSRCHVIDLPMPGRICSAIALEEPVANVYATGWPFR